MKIFVAFSLFAFVKASTAQQCSNTKFCKLKGGVCTIEKECQAENLAWIPELCDLQGTNVDGCGCCIRLDPVCFETNACSQAGGSCIPKEDCDPLTALCSAEMCNPNNDPSVSCVCKAPLQPPPPKCEQTNECGANGGKCMDRESCPSDWLFEPKLCALDGDVSEDCGCCIPPPVPTAKPTASPLPVCKTDDKCDANGGKCVNRGECPSDMVYEPRLCDLYGQASDECGCCMPKNPEPVCEPKDDCYAKGGKCMQKEQCSEDMIFETKLCSFADGTNENCGCCLPREGRRLRNNDDEHSN